jgi:hypothetical protein
MRLRGKIRALLMIVLLAGLPAGYLPQTDAATQHQRPRQIRKKPVTRGDSRGGETRAGVERRGAAVLWRDPGRIESLDLFYGPGGRDGAPNPSDRFKLLRRMNSGTSKKISVEDERGRKWVVKFGPEARPETAATRLVWAMGYHADETYFVKRARVFDGKKSFSIENVRFERRHDGFKEVGKWSWKQNPYVGTRELDGLKTMMAVLNNWDLKKVNNSILCPEEGGRCVYFVSDLGATFGKTDSFWRKIFFFADLPAGSKGKPRDYAGQKLIDETRRGEVDFHYKGKNPSALDGVRVESARWLGDQLARLSDKQLADVFRASGFNGRETALYTSALRQRIRQLRNLE